jgi:hypothetical protein
MANCFIPYIPKPTNAKHSSKPPCKNVSNQPSTFDSSQQIERNSVSIRTPAVDSDLLMQKMNRYDRIIAKDIHIYPILLYLILMQLESLTEICKGINSDEDNDMYFPTVQELIAGQSMSGGHTSKAVDKPALDDDDSINPNSENSQTSVLIPLCCRLVI